MITIENLTFRYNGSLVHALQNVNMQINSGEFVLISGKSGSGKTSLCRVINGLIPHFHGGMISGTVNVDGLSPIDTSPGIMSTKVGMVFQDPENQLVTSDAGHEICFGMENLAFPRDLITERLENVLEMLDISHLRNRPFREMSGGEKQRVAIASVLALRPEVLILDEPTSELDPEGYNKILSCLHFLNRELGLTVIVVEHRLDRFIEYADRLIVIEDGQIILDCPARLAMAEHGDCLQSCGIGLPPVVQLHQKLKERGALLASVPLSVDEASRVFKEVFNKPLSIITDNNGVTGSVPAVEMDGVSFYYSKGIKAIDNVTLRIDRGEFVALMGCNASGKTTLVKLANGLISPDTGTIKILGQNASNNTVAELAASVGVVFQNPGDHLFTDTVEDEIAFGLKLRGLSAGQIMERVNAMLCRFNLEHCHGRSPHDLSMGEKQRLALASIMAYNPPVLLLDEPDRGSEERARQYLISMLGDYSSTGNTVIMVTHDVELVAGFAGRVIMMDKGKIIFDGDKHEVLPESMLYSPQINRLVKRYKHQGVSSKFLTADEVVNAIK